MACSTSPTRQACRQQSLRHPQYPDPSAHHPACATDNNARRHNIIYHETGDIEKGASTQIVFRHTHDAFEVKMKQIDYTCKSSLSLGGC